MVDAEAYAFRLSEVHAVACATCYLPLDEIRITEGWRRQRVAAPRGSNSLHHRACILGVPTSAYRDCPARDASFLYDPDLACLCGKPVTRETARPDRTCIVVAHQNRTVPAASGADEREANAGPRVRLYHEQCVLGGDRPVLVPLLRSTERFENLAALAFVHTRGAETRLDESSVVHALAPGFSLAGVPVFAWVKSDTSPLAADYFKAAKTLLPRELLALGARRVARGDGGTGADVLCHDDDDNEHVYVACEYRDGTPGVYPFVASRSGATGEASGGGGGGGGVSVGIVRLASGKFFVPPRWVDLVARLQADEQRPTIGPGTRAHATSSAAARKKRQA
jgi:hypothetical protein